MPGFETVISQPRLQLFFFVIVKPKTIRSSKQSIQPHASLLHLGAYVDLQNILTTKGLSSTNYESMGPFFWASGAPYGTRRSARSSSAAARSGSSPRRGTTRRPRPGPAFSCPLVWSPRWSYRPTTPKETYLSIPLFVWSRT